jgi:hypothetical protein
MYNMRLGKGKKEDLLCFVSNYCIRVHPRSTRYVASLLHVIQQRHCARKGLEEEFLRVDIDIDIDNGQVEVTLTL